MTSFQTGELVLLGKSQCLIVMIAMLASVLPKLTNLKVFRCQMGNDALISILGVLEKSHPRLQGLVIAWIFFLVNHSVPPHQTFSQTN
jgi:hypothetical protein